MSPAASWTDALEQVEARLRADPDDLTAKLQKAEFLFKLDRFGDAETFLKQLMQDKPAIAEVSLFLLEFDFQF
jgi:predicted Zn-dependent protease